VLIALAVVTYTFVVGTHSAGAQAAGGGGVFATIQDAAAAAMGQWMNNSLGYGWALFVAVGVTAFFAKGVRFYSVNHTLVGSESAITESLFAIIGPLALFKLAQNFLPGVFTFAGRVAGGITGVPISGPSAIYTLGIQRGLDIFNACGAPMKEYLAQNPLAAAASVAIPAASLFSKTPALQEDLALWALGALAMLVIVGAFTFIAAELLLSIVHLMITFSIGAVQLGWSASPATASFSSTYWGGIMAGIFRLIVIYGTASFISTAALTAFNVPGAGVDPGILFKMGLNALAFALASAYIVVRLPRMAENVFSGRPSFAATEMAVVANQAAVRAVARLAGARA